MPYDRRTMIVGGLVTAAGVLGPKKGEAQTALAPDATERVAMQAAAETFRAWRSAMPDTGISSITLHTGLPTRPRKRRCRRTVAFASRAPPNR